MTTKSSRMPTKSAGGEGREYPLLVWSESGAGFILSLPAWFDKERAAVVFANAHFRSYIEKRADDLVKAFYGSKATLDILWDKNTGLQHVSFGGGNCTCTGIESSTLLEGRETPIYTHNIDTLNQAIILREVWMNYIVHLPKPSGDSEK